MTTSTAEVKNNKVWVLFSIEDTFAAVYGIAL
jgi:hypothetical protein